MAYHKNKKYIEINDYDKYHQITIEQDLSTGFWCDEEFEDECYSKIICNCDFCNPDIGNYYKIDYRERRFQKLFNENSNRIMDIVGTMSYSQILERSN